MLKVDRIIMERKIANIDNGVNRPFNIEEEAQSSSRVDLEM